jgi:hypothetical protein
VVEVEHDVLLRHLVDEVREFWSGKTSPRIGPSWLSGEGCRPIWPRGNRIERALRNHRGSWQEGLYAVAWIDGG